ncbi:hypothetical protein CEXT_657371 [Caerostris extrusa]|uniref:Uncharacterized protein n=1 Tax=Caerostris extrusa TaxID=172846 RepID=A0AAV4V144_CAEEX|nr:hypothetical protein CEXT_657371 [Caerostris extrusa]
MASINVKVPPNENCSPFIKITFKLGIHWNTGAYSTPVLNPLMHSFISALPFEVEHSGTNVRGAALLMYPREPRHR